VSKLIQEIMDAINAVSKNKTEPYDRQGEVKRIEGKIAWVKLEGSDRETPIQMTIACDVGDTVQARIGGGSAWLTGNLTAPPTDDKKANQAITMVTNIAETVQETVDEALENVSDVEDVTMEYCLSDSSSSFVQYGDWSATMPTYVSGKYYWTRSVIEDDEGNVTYGEPRYSQDTQLSVETDVAFKSNNNHFWYDSSGAYVTTADKSYANGSAVRITASGILQQVNGNTVSSWTNSGISFLQGGSTVASFGSGGCYIYGTNGGYMAMTSDGMTLTTYSDYWQRVIQMLKISMSGETVTMQAPSNSYLAISPGIASAGGIRANGSYYAGGYKLLTIGTVTGSAVTVSASSTNSGSVSASMTGYTPIGIIGMSRSGTSSTYVNIYNWYLSGTTIYWAGRNLHTSDATVTPTFYVLYIATTQGY